MTAKRARAEDVSEEEQPARKRAKTELTDEEKAKKKADKAAKRKAQRAEKKAEEAARAQRCEETKDARLELAEELGLYRPEPPPYPSPYHREIDMAMRGAERKAKEGKFWGVENRTKSNKWKAYVARKCCIKCEIKCESIQEYRPFCGKCRFPIERESKERAAWSAMDVAIDPAEKKRLRAKYQWLSPLPDDWAYGAACAVCKAKPAKNASAESQHVWWFGKRIAICIACLANKQ